MARLGTEYRFPYAERGGDFTLSTAQTAEWLLGELVPTDDQSPVFEGNRVGRENINLSTNEISNAIWRMAPNKAPGLDGITTAVLRKSWLTAGPVLTRLLCRCLRTFTFPDVWKRTEVVVIPKLGVRDPSSPKSYRPVSLLSVPSKVLERLIVDRLIDETSANMSRDQHGFVRGRSTTSAFKTCLEWIDSRQESVVIGTFLDIKGALCWSSYIQGYGKVGSLRGI